MAVLFIGFSTALFCYEIAVVPYRAEFSGKNEADAGEDYAKIVGLVARVKYGDKLYSSVQIARDMRSYRIDPSATINADDLITIGKSRYMDYILTGTIYKGENGYTAASLLFSPQKGSVVSRSRVSAKSLYELAERDLDELYNYHIPQKKHAAAATADFVILIDSSYYNAEELPSIKAAILATGEHLYNAMPGSRICLVGFSDKQQYVSHEWCGGIAKLNSALAKIKPYGRGTEEGLAQALRFIARDLQLQSQNRTLWIYTNTPLASGKLVREARELLSRKMELTVVAGSRVPAAGGGYAPLAESTKGALYYASYHQRFIDHNQKEYHLFYERGRIYVSAAVQEWRGGVKALKMRTIEKEGALPANFAAIAREQGETVVDTAPLETNIADLTQKRYSAQKLFSRVKLPVARVLLGYDNLTVWCDVTEQSDLDFFKRQKNTGFTFFLGVRIKEDKNSPYGSSILPLYFYDIEPEAVPEALKAPLSQLLSNPQKYAREGLLSPPLWFTNVSVVEIREVRAEEDIR